MTDNEERRIEERIQELGHALEDVSVDHAERIEEVKKGVFHLYKLGTERNKEYDNRFDRRDKKIKELQEEVRDMKEILREVVRNLDVPLNSLINIAL